MNFHYKLEKSGGRSTVRLNYDLVVEEWESVALGCTDPGHRVEVMSDTRLSVNGVMSPLLANVNKTFSIDKHELLLDYDDDHGRLKMNVKTAIIEMRDKLQTMIAEGLKSKAFKAEADIGYSDTCDPIITAAKVTKRITGEYTYPEEKQ